MGLMTSPLRGADGNVEFLLHARARATGRAGRPRLAPSAVDAVVREAASAAMSTVALFVHGGRPTPSRSARTVAAWLAERGHAVVLGPTRPSCCAGRRRRRGRRRPRRLDLVVAIGGDGTMLRATRRAVAADADVLGINLGQLGYLAEVEPDGWEAALERLLRRPPRRRGARWPRGAPARPLGRRAPTLPAGPQRGRDREAGRWAAPSAWA